jgi:hypothetical protein
MVLNISVRLVCENASSGLQLKLILKGLSLDTLRSSLMVLNIGVQLVCENASSGRHTSDE